MKTEPDDPVRTLLHELNNALHVIAMNSELAAMQLSRDQPGPATHSIQKIVEKCSECERISVTLAKGLPGGTRNHQGVPGHPLPDEV